ncbi:ATP-binding protein [Actinacidiphila yeochonensis]|uniref:hypothetical protein n=1 Tax=Actinacidiphila yeochonensis TaxID=89050 RepID=UPI00056C02F0|nr:hypothetical protein [Actinacidiphila yeochonensis]
MIEPVCDDFSVRIAVSAEEKGVLKGGAPGRWVERLRRLSTVKLPFWGLSKLVGDVESRITELVTNGLRHGVGSQVVCRQLIGVGCVAAAVDEGSSRRPKILRPEPCPENGRGTVLVHALAASSDVAEYGTRTRPVFASRLPTI